MMSHYKGLYKNKDGPQAAVTHKPFKNVVNTMHHLGNKWDRLLELDRDRPDSGPVAFER